MTRASLTACVLLLSTSALAQSPARLGEVTFTVPADWSAVPDTGGGMKLSPTVLAPGALCVIVVRPAEALTGDFASWFSRIWLPFSSGANVVQSTPPQHQGMAGSPNDAMFAAAILRDDNQTPYFVEGFAIQAGQRAIPVFWTVNRRELLNQYLQAVRQLLYSVTVSRVAANQGGVADSMASANTIVSDSSAADTATVHASDTAALSRGSVSARRLDGPYLGLYMGYGLGLSIYSTHISQRILVFNRDGSVFYAPEKGLAGFDVQSALRDGTLESDWYGHYTLQDGGGILVQFPRTSLRLLLDENGINPSMGRYIPLCTCTDLRLEGSFKVSGTESFITFTRDGRFVDRTGAIRELLQYSFADEERKTGIIGYGEKITQPGTGTYHIVRNTISLSYSDGRRITSSFYAPARALSERPPWLLIHEQQLEP